MAFLINIGSRRERAVTAHREERRVGVGEGEDAAAVGQGGADVEPVGGAEVGVSLNGVGKSRAAEALQSGLAVGQEGD